MLQTMIYVNYITPGAAPGNISHDTVTTMESLSSYGRRSGKRTTGFSDTTGMSLREIRNPEVEVNNLLPCSASTLFVIFLHEFIFFSKGDQSLQEDFIHQFLIQFIEIDIEEW
jgi:hypothetical protein